MKITIGREMDLKKAGNLLRDFLLENYSDYPVLKRDVDIYITLKNHNDQNCPDNEKEFRLTSDGVIDVANAKMMHAVNILRHLWGQYISKERSHVWCIKQAVKRDEKYLAPAEEKGRNPEKVAQRKEELEKRLTELPLLEEHLAFSERLNEIVQNKTARIQCSQIMYNNSPYGSDYRAQYVFENIDGKNYYFFCDKVMEGFPDF